MSGHSLSLCKDDGNWDYAECSCGWVCMPVPGADIASEVWADHLLSMTGERRQS